MTITLPRAAVPDHTALRADLRAVFHTGANARDALAQFVPGTVAAIDIETPSVTDSFSIKCVTAAFVGRDGQTHGVLFDPLRNPLDHAAASWLCASAGALVLHKSTFDTPGLVHHGIMRMADIRKVLDTIIYARMAWPDSMTRKSLESLAVKVLRLPYQAGGLKRAQQAGGYTSQSDWFDRADIDVPFYRDNAIADTVVTLALLAPLREAAVARQLDHPFARRGLSERGEAERLVDDHQRANHVVLARCARGFAIDLEYLDRYRDTIDQQKTATAVSLREAGIKPGNGLAMVKRLAELGELPPGWPTTDTGQLSSAAKYVKLLNHPLAAAHSFYAKTTKIEGYLDKTVARAAMTGRLHPQIDICGASATGRMSASEPEIQQFPEAARPILLTDDGAGWSLDWKSIEPALLGWLADDREFMTPYENGVDIYQRIMDIARITRTPAKVLILALTYGQSLGSMAISLGVDINEAKSMKRRVFSAMPRAAALMEKVKIACATHGVIVTVSGRVLTIPRINGEYASYMGVNYLCQGSNWDLLCAAILEADRRGLADHLFMFMHDEIDTDATAAREVAEIMATPVPGFARWTTHTPVIRVDPNFMGSTWLKC